MCHSGTILTMADGMQQRVTQNVRVLMAVRRIMHQQQLAELIGWKQYDVSRRFSGRAKWQLEDLPKVAAALGVQPADLLKEVTEVVGAAAATGTDARPEGMIPDMIRCSSLGSSRKIASSAQVIALPNIITGESDYVENITDGELLTVTTWGQPRRSTAKRVRGGTGSPPAKTSAIRSPARASA